MIPHTSDGRVLFAVPWHDHVVVGTTDTPIDHADEEPKHWRRKLSLSSTMPPST